MPATINLKTAEETGQPQNAILHLKSATVLTHRFEFHPQTRKLYVIRVGAMPDIAELMGENIASGSIARAIAAAFYAGFREGAGIQLGAAMGLKRDPRAVSEILNAAMPRPAVAPAVD